MGDRPQEDRVSKSRAANGPPCVVLLLTDKYSLNPIVALPSHPPLRLKARPTSSFRAPGVALCHRVDRLSTTGDRVAHRVGDGDDRRWDVEIP